MIMLMNSTERSSSNTPDFFMLLNILTHGWLVRGFVVILWGVGLLLPETVIADQKYFLFVLFGASNGFLYLSVANRISVLITYSQAKILPHFYDLLKKALLSILVVSLLPTLALLEQPLLCLSLLSFLILLAMVFVTFIYQPKLYWLFVIMMLMPYPIEKTGVMLDVFYVDNALAYLFPLIAYAAYYLLMRLETFKGSPQHLAKMVAFTNLSTKTMVADDQIPFEARNKFWRWIINGDFSYYRKLINSEKCLSQLKLITIACQGVASVGRYTYIFWGITSVLFIMIARQLSIQHQQILIVIMIIFPTMMIGTGTLMLFQSVNNKKALLQQLSITPCFANKQSFVRVFLRYIISDQIKLYGFIFIVLALTVYNLHYISWFMYANVLCVGVLLCLLNLTFMFDGWSSKLTIANLTFSFMLLSLICALVFILVISSVEQLLLWQNNYFLFVFLVCLAMFLNSVKSVYQKFPLSLG